MIYRKNARIIMEKEYEKKMMTFFNSWIKSYCGIDCFAILVILPDNDMIHISTHPNLTEVYNERKYGLFDQPVLKKYYTSYQFYPWRLPSPTKKQNEIHTVREKIFNLNAGTNFVRLLDSPEGRYHIIYCISTHDQDPLNYFRFASNVTKILEIGDFAYNTFLPT